MTALRNLSVRGKVLLIVGAGILFQVIIASTGLYYLNLSNQSLTTTVDVEAKSIRQAGRVRMKFLDLIISEKNMIMDKTEDTKAQHKATFDSDRLELESRWSNLRKVAESLHKKHIAAFEQEYREYLTVHQSIRDLSARNDDAEAMRLSTTTARDHAQKARAALGSLRDEFESSLDLRKRDNDAKARMAMTLIIAVLLVTLLFAIGLGLVVTRTITTGLGNMVGVADSIAGGNLETQIDISGRDEIARLASSVEKMQATLRATRIESEDQDWIKTGLARLNNVMVGDPEIDTLASEVISEVATYLDAQVGAFYLASDGEKPMLSLLGSYAYTKRKNLSNVFEAGEGLVGQAALEKQQILVKNVPEDYVRVTSGLGEHIPRFICVTPFLYEGRVKGVVETGTLGEMSEKQMEYLDQAMPAVAVAVESAQARSQLEKARREAMLRVSYLQGLNSPVMAIDKDFNVMFANAYSLELLKQTEAAVVGRKCYDLWKTGDCQTERCACARAMRQGQTVVARTNSDLEMPIQYAGSPLMDTNGALLGAVELITDVTELTEALEESQRLTKELQIQQEELKTTNEELEEQTQALKQSEEKLRAQQEEMEVVNEELEEKNELLGRQKKDVERARKEIEEKAEELALASKYKSEFLANMSHELRTPLNSLLLLASTLSENKEGNLTDNQVESARVIYGSGNDLLNLINEILDLSKIEAGRMTLHTSKVRVQDLADGIATSFRHMADQKGLGLSVNINEGVPREISTDRKRVEQVIKNLLSNAIKFTESGGISITIGRPNAGVDLSRSCLSHDRSLYIAFTDTGIGISPEQQKVIFEAFQQAESGTTRRHGGTGLGLSISRELAHLLGGEIQVESEQGKGSTFTLYLPIDTPEVQEIQMEPASRAKTTAEASSSETVKKAMTQKQIKDDRDSLEKDDKVILVIEDDQKFAKLLYAKCHEKKIKCVASPMGEAGLNLARSLLPSAVILDIRLPGMDGWTVLNVLKDDPRTRHIPVHIMSVEEASTEALRKGAIGHLTKPVDKNKMEEAFCKIEDITSRRVKHLLVVEDDEETRRAIVELVGNGDVKVDEAARGEHALEALRSKTYDCVILDLGLKDMEGDELLRKLNAEDVKVPPVIAYTARDLTREEEMSLREHAESIILKDVRSQERLMDEVSLFLHQVVSEMPDSKRQIITNLHDTDLLFRDKKVLIVDDDMRTSFALSRLLSDRGVKTWKAENGEKALRLLEQEPDIDLVLMDIMMPVMDGHEAMEKIRAQEKFKKLPIIALTAKAMKEDRERCLASGASDYLPKPVDHERLISMLRVWLYR